ncbi:MAG TPA: hypothetical protein VF761_14070 [Gemmatimonadaceae bacterium]
MVRQGKLEWPVRFLAAVFGVASLGLAAGALWRFLGLERTKAFGFAALGVIFLWGAVRGETPPWLATQYWEKRYPPKQ